MSERSSLSFKAPITLHKASMLLSLSKSASVIDVTELPPLSTNEYNSLIALMRLSISSF